MSREDFLSDFTKELNAKVAASSDPVVRIRIVVNPGFSSILTDVNKIVSDVIMQTGKSILMNVGMPADADTSNDTMLVYYPPFADKSKPGVFTSLLGRFFKKG